LVKHGAVEVLPPQGPYGRPAGFAPRQRTIQTDRYATVDLLPITLGAAQIEAYVRDRQLLFGHARKPDRDRRLCVQARVLGCAHRPGMRARLLPTLASSSARLATARMVR
jgi:hypothetical protein